MSHWTFGDITVDRVLEFEQPLGNPSWLYPTSSAEGVARQVDWLAPDHYDVASGLLILAFHTFVIRTPRYTILVDTCSGNDRHRPQKTRYHMKSWPYLERLAAVGVRPEAVDYVLCTHLHVDHVGWNTRLVNGRWVPTFPNARYLFARAEWSYWEAHYKTEAFTDDPYYVDCILPVLESRQVDLVDGAHPIDTGVRLDPSPGHTPGHVNVMVEGGGRRAVMSGDLMHHAIQCAEPDWHSCFCVDPARSSGMRRTFFDRYAETDTLIMPAHFATPTAGRIVRAGDAWRFKFQPKSG
jgi:glyoxylase-like metal-dependent hydrolase (beta-lactamase superfamily II)